MDKRPLILLAEPLPPEPTDWIAERCRLARCAPEDPEFAARLGETDALVVRTATRVDAAMIAAAPRLRVVGRAGVGVDNIDLEACRLRGVTVVHAPDANTQAVVEYVLWLIGDALRPRAALSTSLDATEWERARQELQAARQASECVLGILGLGRIGRRLAEVARTLGLAVRYCDLLDIPPAQRFGAEPLRQEELFAESDIVSIHVDGRAENRGLVGASLLNRMRPNAILINTARGLVVDAESLAAHLRSRPATLALLDVHEPEPVPAGHPLLALPNCHLFPHLASRTRAATDAMGWVVRDVMAVLEGAAPRHAVAPAAASAAGARPPDANAPPVSS